MKATDARPPRRAARSRGARPRELYVRGGGLTPGVTIHLAHCCTPGAGRSHRGHPRERRRAAWPSAHTSDLPQAGRNTRTARTSGAYPSTGPRRPSAKTMSAGPPHRHVSATRRACWARSAPKIIGEAGGNIVNLRMHHRPERLLRRRHRRRRQRRQAPDQHLGRPAHVPDGRDGGPDAVGLSHSPPL